MPEALLEHTSAEAQGVSTGRSVSGRSSRRLGLYLAIPAVLLFATAAARYLSGQSTIDLVVFDQGIWALSQGHSPFSSVIGETLLEDHFGPGLLLFGALYRLAATPLWLIAGQTAAAWVAVWLIARRVLPSVGEKMAILIGAALFISPPVAYALLADVHNVVFAIPFALAAAFDVEDGRPRRALLFGLLAALFRVEVGIAVVVVLLLFPGSRRGRLRPTIALAVYVAVAMYFEKILGHDSYWPIHYGHLGSSPVDALLHPLGIASAVLTFATAAVVLPWLATTGFLGLRELRRLTPAVILSLPVLLSQWPGARDWHHQYGLAPALLLSLAWIPVLCRNPQRAPRVLAGCLAISFLLGPVTPSVFFPGPGEVYAARFWTGDQEVDCIISGIPATAAVSAERPIMRLGHRENLYLWPYPFEGVPQTVLPADHLAEGVPEFAAEVDYIVVRRSEAGNVPEGFLADGVSEHYERFRREGTTQAGAPSCSL
jgi:uncharacterized membrane protein